MFVDVGRQIVWVIFVVKPVEVPKNWLNLVTCLCSMANPGYLSSFFLIPKLQKRAITHCEATVYWLHPFSTWDCADLNV
jgi:hypothetical protein